MPIFNNRKNYLWAQQGLNLRPSHYECAALTTELWAHFPLACGTTKNLFSMKIPIKCPSRDVLSWRRGSNPRPDAYKATALPLSYSSNVLQSRTKHTLINHMALSSVVGKAGLEPATTYAQGTHAATALLSAYGAKDGAQTRDPLLGRQMLYQLSYFRNRRGWFALLTPTKMSALPDFTYTPLGSLPRRRTEAQLPVRIRFPIFCFKRMSLDWRRVSSSHLAHVCRSAY